MKFEDIEPGELFEIERGNSFYICLRLDDDQYVDIEMYLLNSWKISNSNFRTRAAITSFKRVFLDNTTFKLVCSHGKIDLDTWIAWAKDLENMVPKIESGRIYEV